jgi:hypothetical protein
MSRVFNYGVCYGPSLPGDSYCKDWFTTDYKCQWSSDAGCRGDLADIRALGFRHIRGYYWDPDSDHSQFLAEAQKMGIAVEVPIHNGLIKTRNAGGIIKLVKSTKNYPSVKMYTVGNEMAQEDIPNIVWTINLIRTLNIQQMISHTCIFDAGYASVKALIAALENTRNFIPSVNYYFYSNPSSQAGNCFANAVKDWYNDRDLKEFPLYIGEFGWYGNDTTSAEALTSFIKGVIKAKKANRLLWGASVFEYQNSNWKTSVNGENNYGLITDRGVKKQTYFSIQAYARKMV